MLATPTSFWQHHIEPQSAFPQQLFQVTKIFSLRPPTFLSIKTNELTLTLGLIKNVASDKPITYSAELRSVRNPETRDEAVKLNTVAERVQSGERDEVAAT